MKVIVFTIILCAFTFPVFALDISQIPKECEGKTINCITHTGGTCLAIYCPPGKTYDSNGNIISESSGCNPCSFSTTEECWCGDHHFYAN